MLEDSTLGGAPCPARAPRASRLPAPPTADTPRLESEESPKQHRELSAHVGTRGSRGQQPEGGAEVVPVLEDPWVSEHTTVVYSLGSASSTRPAPCSDPTLPPQPLGAVLGLRFCARAFSSCGEQGPLFIAVRRPLTVAASLVAEHRLQTRRLSGCGSRA